MARGIYEVKLKERYFPAISAEDALEMQNNGTTGALLENETEVTCIVKEEHTMKLFLLAKTMNDTEKFEFNEVESAVCALARELGYYNTYAEVANCVLTWVERFDEMTLSDLEEWIIG